jgi:hypothetical protein
MWIPELEWFFYRSVYTEMHLITAPDMCAITFEMIKEVNMQRLEHDDEFTMCLISSTMVQDSMDLM